jgi:hypothetical protein
VHDWFYQGSGVTAERELVTGRSEVSFTF